VEWSLITAVILSLGFAVGGEVLIALLTGLPAVREMAAEFLPWMIAMPILAVGSYLLDGIFIGATRTRHAGYHDSVGCGLLSAGLVDDAVLAESRSVACVCQFYRCP